MRIKKNSFVGYSTVYLLLLAISVAATIICLDDNSRPAGYEKLYLLPLSATLCFMFFCFYLIKDKITNNIPNILLIVFTTLRNVITPITMVIDSYESSLGIPNAENVQKAILLVFYETIAIYAFLFLYNNIKSGRKIKITTNIGESKQIFNLLFYGMVGASILALLLVPQLRSQYYTIFTNDITHIVQEEATYSVGTVLRILATLGEVCLGAVRIVLPTFVIYKIACKGQTAVNLILALCMVLVQCLFMNDSNAYILMVMISQFLLVYKLFPKYKRAIVVGLTVFSILFLVLLYINRFMMDHYATSLSLFLQSYLPGVANTAGIFNVIPEHNFFQIFEDIFVAIPFKSTFGYSGWAQSINAIWQEANNCMGQIMPTIAGSYYYFGFWLAPILSCFFVYVANRLNKKMKNEGNVMLYAVQVYLMMYSVATPFVYNGCIYFQCILQRVIFMYIVAKFAPFKFSDIKHLDKDIEGQEKYERVTV